MSMLPEGATYRLSSILAGGALAAVPAISMIGPVPAPLSPFPVPFLLAVWFLGPLGSFSFLLLPLAFWLAFPGLARGVGSIPARFLGIVIAAAAASLALTAAGFRFASEYQGVAYAWTVTAVNVLAPLALLAAYRANRSKGSWPIAFGSCWLLFAWIGSYAFAYLGKLP